MHKLTTFILFSLVLSWPGPPAGAQSACEVALREAERNYLIGRLEEVLAVREACLGGRRAPRRERVRAWALLAKAYLALDRRDEAVAAVDALVGLDPDYRAARGDPLKLERLIDEARDSFTVRVGTVSKTDEPLREAPATVIVLTGEEIECRGYLDLEQLLHDLPGFDLSRGNGDVYSNVYMRGYRSDRSDRLLFLVDGIEQNDLHSNTAHISRQYPLSNVDGVEVVYGPASTIYGANAFTGVISVTTKTPREMIAEGEKVAVHAQVLSGSYGTRALDFTVAGRSESRPLAWSLTGRRFRSDEPDLSGFSDWDYDFVNSLDEVDYKALMRIDGALAHRLGTADVDDDCFFSGFCELVTENGEVVAIELTDEGEEAARERDRALFALLGSAELAALVGPLAFSDATDDWALGARLRLGGLTFGLETWRREEGTTPWYTDFLRAGRDAGNLGTPEQTSIYVRYSQPIGRDLLLNFFARYKQHDSEGSAARFITYAGEALSVVDLAVFEEDSTFQLITFGQKSTQFRNEVTLTYEPSGRFDLVGGIELRVSSVQLEFKSEVPVQEPRDPIFGAFPFFPAQLADARTEQTDLGVFAQASYRPREDLKIVAGGRIDVNRFGSDQESLFFEAPGFDGSDNVERVDVTLEESGSVFHPRLALVHTRGDWVLKAIYSEAFKEPSNFQKFTRDPGVREFVNQDLESERVRNAELGVSWQRGALLVDVTAYQADYSNAVSLQRQVNSDLAAFPTESGRFENIGRLRIRGLQANLTYRHGRFELFGNATWTDPVNLDPVDELGNPLPVGELRIGDIAGHRLNLSTSTELGKRWGVHLRANYVGDRDTGDGTTVRDNPFDEIDSYLVVHGAVSYQGLFPGATLQLVVDNLFDREYFHPGVQRAGVGFAARLPQPGRSFFVRLSYKR